MEGREGDGESGVGRLNNRDCLEKRKTVGKNGGQTCPATEQDIINPELSNASNKISYA